MPKYLLFFIVFVLPTVAFAQKVKLDQLKLPPGFQIEIFADNVKSAREMALGKDGTVFVGSTVGNVYAITSHNNNPTKRQVKLIASGLNQPQGVAIYKNDLYVAEVDRIIRYEDIEKNLDQAKSAMLVTDEFATKKPLNEQQAVRHGWKTIRFGPDGKLYVAIGMPCDSCLPKNELEGTIARLNPDGTDFEVYAKGVRNSVGFDWQPGSQQLWFTDNGRDNLGDNTPPDKLNYAPRQGLDFGFPYYLGADNKGQPIPDPEYGKSRSPEGITWQAWSFPAHVAALNMLFYTGRMFPPEYKNQIFIAEHGSWNRSKKVGYQVSMVKVTGGQALSYEPFITGWKKNEKYWGRPVGLLELPDGSLLISDDYAGVIYRVTYQKS